MDPGLSASRGKIVTLELPIHFVHRSLRRPPPPPHLNWQLKQFSFCNIPTLPQLHKLIPPPVNSALVAAASITILRE